MTEQMMKELIQEEGLSEEVVRLRMADEDLWLLRTGQRFDEDLQGEEGVRVWEEAAQAARTVADAVCNGPGTIQASPAITMLVWDAVERAEEALARARQRRQAPRVQTPEAEERLRGLLDRCDALSNAYGVVLEEAEVDAEVKTLATLEKMKEEANERFRRYKREVGIPSPSA